MADEINLLITTDDSDLDKTRKKLQGLGDDGQAAGDKGSRGLAGFASGFANMGLGILGAQAGIQALSGAVTGLFSGNIQFEQFETQFKVLLGSADAAKARISELSDFARTTPFELPEVVKASAALETLTQGALATGDGLRLVGDVAAGTGVPMDELAVTMGRLYDSVQSGRSVGEELARLQEIGAVSGETRSQIEAMLEAGVDGAVIWETVADGMGRYSGMMEEQSATVGGALSNISDGLGAMKRNLMQGIFDAAKPGIMAFASWLGSEGVQGAIQKAGQALGAFMGFIASNVISGFTALIAVVGPFVPIIIAFARDGIAMAVPYLQQFGETLTNLVPQIIAFVQAFAEGALDHIMTAFQTLSPILEPVAGAFLLIAANVPAAVAGFLGLLGALEPLMGIIDATLGWIVGNAPVMNALLAAMGVIILSSVVPAVIAWTAAEWAKVAAMVAANVALIAANLPLIALVAAVALLVAGITLLVTHWDTITAKVPLLGTAFDAVKAIIETVINWFRDDFVNTMQSAFEKVQDIVDTVWNAISGIFEVQWAVIKVIVETHLEIIKTVIETVLGVIEGIINVVMGVISGDWDQVWTGIKQIADSIWEGIKSLIDIGINAIKDIIDIAMGVIDGLWSAAWEGIKTIASAAWEELKSSVSNGIDEVVQFFTDLPGRILGAIGDLGGLLSGVGGRIIDGLIGGIRGKFEDVKSTLGELTGMLPDWKGPADKDATLLEPVGKIIIGGLVNGMEEEFASVEKTLADFTARLASNEYLPASGLPNGPEGWNNPLEMFKRSFKAMEESTDSLSRRVEYFGDAFSDTLSFAGYTSEEIGARIGSVMEAIEYQIAMVEAGYYDLETGINEALTDVGGIMSISEESVLDWVERFKESPREAAAEFNNMRDGLRYALGEAIEDLGGFGDAAQYMAEDFSFYLNGIPPMFNAITDAANEMGTAVANAAAAIPAFAGTYSSGDASGGSILGIGNPGNLPTPIVTDNIAAGRMSEDDLAGWVNILKALDREGFAMWWNDPKNQATMIGLIKEGWVNVDGTLQKNGTNFWTGQGPSGLTPSATVPNGGGSNFNISVTVASDGTDPNGTGATVGKAIRNELRASGVA